MQHPEEPDIRAVQADPRRDDQVRLHQILVLFLHDEDVSFSFYRSMNVSVCRCILATDMARHNEILNKFKVMQPVFDFTNKDHKEVVKKNTPNTFYVQKKQEVRSLK